VAENLANETIRRIREALETGRSAGVPEIIRLIQQLSSKAFSITVKELADIIGQDVAISAKVITVANTLRYNPMGVPVSTITQAI
jgi:HD-like signal output (HDOD) protein